MCPMERCNRHWWCNHHGWLWKHVETVTDSRRHPSLPQGVGKASPVPTSPQGQRHVTGQGLCWTWGALCHPHGMGEWACLLLLPLQLQCFEDSGCIPVPSAGVRDGIKQLQHMSVPPEDGESSISQGHPFRQS